METVNRPDRLHTISSDRGHWGDRGDYMETRLKVASFCFRSAHEADLDESFERLIDLY